MGKWIEESGIINCPTGLLGFPHTHRFMILESDVDQPIFRWLQSVDDSEVAFLVADPEIFIENYWETVSVSDLSDCDLQPFEMPIFLVIITVPAEDPYTMTANLLAPLVLSPRTKTIKQVVLSNSNYSSQHPIFERVRAALVGGIP